LIAIPHEYGFSDQDKSCLGLKKLAVQEKFGFVWCVPGGGPAPDIATFLGPDICRDFESFNTGGDVSYDVRIVERPVNWKLTVDTFLENYHVKHAHRTTIDHYFLDNICVCQQFGPHVRLVFPKKTITELEGKNKADWEDIRKHANILYAIFPNTLILMEPDHVSVSHVYPKAIDSTKVVSYTLLQKYPESDKAKAYWAKNNDILYTALEEDFDMARLVQQGLHSGANENLIHGKFEKGLRYFHEAVRQNL
jgi:phenylpropionate dioxygenase-like ring-hydroxylating dioxygenase large terminal subunit